MMDMHKESKGKNFNPYVFKERGRPTESPSVTGNKSLKSVYLLLGYLSTDTFLR
jgi:hypothetical protein